MLTPVELHMRTEQQIFDDLTTLCARPGYIHALAALCFSHNIVGYADELKAEDYAKLFSFDRLNRPEISTLLGLMARVPLDLSLPSQQQIKGYMDQSEALLKELHEAMAAASSKDFAAALKDPSINPFASAEAMREPIFYAAESAYSFQYRDLAPLKYARDADWLRQHKGFTIDEARQVVKAILTFINQHLMDIVKGLRDVPPDKRTVLDGFSFSIADILEASELPFETVRKVLEGFTFPGNGNPTFTALHEYNATNAYPLLKAGENRYILFQYVSLTEALYDTPFFWMMGDAAYKDVAADHRGTFTEEFAAERLAHVFGAANVYRNVDIWQSKGKKLGEIDVLVLFADRAIVVQAKSKRLTLVARKGNDLQLQADFKGAVQDACDQALACSQHLLSGKALVTDAAGNEIAVPKRLKAVHLVCLVSDHYPGLSFQAHQFLKSNASPPIHAPLVSDLFFLDTITEMLVSPLRCLSYLELRASAGNNILLSHEITALAFHLRQNLWLGEHNTIYLEDDISAPLDVAMAVRRDGVDGKRTPAGILTLLEGTTAGNIIDEIEKSAHSPAIDVGLQLLKLSSDAARDLSALVDRLAAQAAKDGQKHDATMAISKASTGITVHCTGADHLSAVMGLKRYCELRKYKQRAQSWCGIVVEPGTGKYRLGIRLEYPWQQDKDLDEKVHHMSPGFHPSGMASFLKSGVVPARREPGRNEPCSCGSGFKYKKCCGRSV